MLRIDLKGQTALVTGGTRGIGKSIADAFLKGGASVIITGTQESFDLSSQDLAAGQSIRYIPLDFSNSSSLNAFLANLKDMNKIDILVNNAGINKISLNVNSVTEDYESVMDVNLKGPYILAREVSKKMIVQESGRIVNISSIWSVVSRSGRSIYGISKWGLVGLTKTLAVELANYGILVNAISPGFTMTELTRNTNTEAELNKIAEAIPLQRLAHPEEIANFVLFLASPLNSYMTGQNIVIDGGYSSV